jgi:hypothetical protein
VVGPAGLTTSNENNALETTETVEIPDIARCLSHRYVSMPPPPGDLEMRSPAAANGRANRKTNFKKPEEITETTAAIQARCLVRLYALSLSTASTIVALAYGVIR